MLATLALIERSQLNIGVRHHTGLRVRVLIVTLLVWSVACVEKPPPIPEPLDALTDSSCEFVRTVAHADPESLINEFVARDARGEFTSSTAWFNGAVTCPGHEPGPDEATQVRSHQLRIIARGRDSVLAEVIWERVGYVGRGADALAPGVDHDTLVALRTEFGWRIASPALDPHVPVPPPLPRP